jgi:hyaluronoglucosaminidase
MFDNDPETYYHSGNGQRTDDFVGADMGVVREVREVRVIQGRNSVDDVDYFDHAIVEYSIDGEQWKELTEPLKGVYDIVWSGEPFQARYIALRKLESEKRNWLAIRAFEVNPVTEDEYAIDDNPYTALSVKGTATFSVPAEATTATLYLGKVGEGATYRLVAESGEILSSSALDTSLKVVELNGASRLEVEGVDEIFEVVFK